MDTISDLDLIHARWEQALQRVADDLPDIQFAGTQLSLLQAPITEPELL